LVALNTSFILVIFILLWKERFSMAFFHIALVFTRQGLVIKSHVKKTAAYWELISLHSRGQNNVM
jgi:hypothetical protein